MCREFHHIHTFSNMEAFGRVTFLILAEGLTTYAKSVPHGVFYGVIFVSPNIEKDWNKYSFAILEAMVIDGNFSVQKYEFYGWNQFKESIKHMKNHKYGFGKIRFKMI